MYIIIDLKSFYASVECAERGLDPFTTNLVVADPDREKGTICLAITPAMKKLGVRNRCRVYEIPPNIKYIMATPRMQLYIDYSASIHAIYLKYVAKEDIHVYSIDEAFLDVSKYTSLYKKNARQIGEMIIKDIKDTTGITATCGIGTNLFLAKVALDIVSKHSPDFIGELDEESFRQKLWKHTPLTDFWRIGPGTARRLATYGILTMEEITKTDEQLLYRLFGIDAELLIDHAWGRESTQMENIKSYRAKKHSVSTGQILLRDYSFEEAEVVLREMAETLCLEMVERGVISEMFTMFVGYSHTFGYPPSGGTVKTLAPTSSVLNVRSRLVELYKAVVNPYIPIRTINLCACNTRDENFQQYDLFIAPEQIDRERKLQHMMIDVKQRFGNNSVLKATNLDKAGTAMQRNDFIGGHKA